MKAQGMTNKKEIHAAFDAIDQDGTVRNTLPHRHLLTPKILLMYLLGESVASYLPYLC